MRERDCFRRAVIRRERRRTLVRGKGRRFGAKVVCNGGEMMHQGGAEGNITEKAAKFYRT